MPLEHPRKVLSQGHVTRRSVLTATRGAALTDSGIAATPTLSPAPASVPPPSAAPPDDPDLAAIEGRPGSRPGVHALDTASGATVSRRSGERFLMASTARLPLAAAVLDRAPVTTRNLLRELPGGPSTVTAFVRGIGDATTRSDRTEPDLDVSTGPDDERAITTPAAIAGSIRAGPLGDGLRPQGECNDVGTVLPPDRAPPLRAVRAVSTGPGRPGLDGWQRHHRRGDRIAVRRLVGR